MSRSAQKSGASECRERAADRVVKLLSARGPIKQRGSGWKCLCPAHADGDPSLDVDIGDGGRVLLRCRSAGCSAAQVCAALGITLADLFDDSSPAKASFDDRVLAAYDYKDEAGKVLFQAVRLWAPAPKNKDFRQRRPTGGNKWAWDLDGVRRVLYRLPGLVAADKGAWVFVVEGEKDADALTALGLVATTNPMGAGKWKPEHAEQLRSRRVVVIPDNDAPGRAHAEDVRKSLRGSARQVVVLELPGLPEKGDVSDWLASGGTALRLLQMVEDRSRPDPSAKSDRQEAVPAGEMVVESLAGLRPKPMRWLVRDRIPAGMMGLLAGEGGHGKSMTTLELAAAVTTGRCAFGLVYPDPVKGSALLISCEDDWERTIAPRLLTLGADMGRVLRVKGVRMKPDGETLDFHMGHFRELEKLITSAPEIRFITIDPAGAYIARSGVNENKDADLRAVLGPLSEVCNRTGATTLLVKHLNKTANVSAVQRVSGSTGYVNAVRFAYMIAPDTDDEQKKLMLPIKANVLPSGGGGLAYRMEPLTEGEARALLLTAWPDMDAEEVAELSKQMFRQKWEGVVTVDPNSLGGRAKTKKEDVEGCMNHIVRLLGAFSWPDEEVEKAVRKAGHSFEVYKTAKARLRVPDKTDPNRLSSKPFEKSGPWWMWIGPQGAPLPMRPASQSCDSSQSCESSHSCQSSPPSQEKEEEGKSPKTGRTRQDWQDWQEGNAEPQSRVAACSEWLMQRLVTGPVRVEPIAAEAARAGFDRELLEAVRPECGAEEICDAAGERSWRIIR
ncbi:AAA family ATPase [Gemmata sp. G18]|uniref:AAA family ATPase n=1 Tax=Gemmata palustris TaxID=2822762 RepID=A0ABS5BP45_9BACT|nr:AAA family ATPase [Gemmata palustris]MBP3955492.1 AAA family ATPase [Gemmata palustris]